MRHYRCADDPRRQHDPIGTAERRLGRVPGNRVPVEGQQADLDDKAQAHDDDQAGNDHLDRPKALLMDSENGPARRTGNKRAGKKRGAEQQGAADAGSEKLGEIGRHCPDLASQP